MTSGALSNNLCLHWLLFQDVVDPLHHRAQVQKVTKRSRRDKS